MNQGVFKNKRVLLTGHTGFKGSWMSVYLHMLGAKLYGVALDPETDPSMFDMLNLGGLFEKDARFDICDAGVLERLIEENHIELIIHMAAQALVGTGYERPADTFNTNVMGTVRVMEAARISPCVKAVLCITTDKVYQNDERGVPFAEDDRLGGSDPYSSSKACAEHVISCYRQAFGLNVASARAGNVIGGGDWAQGRLIPDYIRAYQAGDALLMRNPGAIRPWQHVIDPLRGYLMLAAELLSSQPDMYTGAYNFGPDARDALTVHEVISRLARMLGGMPPRVDEASARFHESYTLRLDPSKAARELGWCSRITLDCALELTAEWVLAMQRSDDLLTLTQRHLQIHAMDVI